MFEDRVDAGRRLADELARFARRDDVIVVGLPRGGVPVAAEVSRVLGVDLDVILVRKLGLPTQPEVAMGAIGENGVRVVDDRMIERAGVSSDALAAVERRERAELERRIHEYRGDERDDERTPLAGRTVIVVDDGIATGSTARAACAVARAEGATTIVLAVPVAPAGWESELRDVADEFVAVETPTPFGAVGNFYADFGQTSDEQVVSALRGRSRPSGGGGVPQ